MTASATNGTWPQITYETLPWVRSDENLLLISKNARRKIKPTYEAAIPATIANVSVELSSDQAARIDALLVGLARFDAQQSVRGYNLPALLLRSESAASSQIENLTSSVRNVALAELTGNAPHNALAIAGNIAAMQTALSLPDEFEIEDICEIHRALIAPIGEDFGGQLRTEQVWVGGTPYSPHGALFVPPSEKRVKACLDDLVKFMNRDNVNPVVRAAIAHAQFETIHPFIDGNGRTGRTLMHKLLRNDGVVTQSAVPISAGLLHNIDEYMASLSSYQQGNPCEVINQVIDALELALTISSKVVLLIDAVFEKWEDSIRMRKTSSIYQLPKLLAEQPVVNSSYVAKHLNITVRAANNLIEKACEFGMLKRIGTSERNINYQATDLIEVLEDISSVTGIRRVLAK